MQVFRLETPIMNKIKTFVDEAVSDGNILANQIIDYYDFSLDEGFLQVNNLDGAIAVFAPEIDFPESMSTKTENQEDFSFIYIDAYGFGDPVEDGVEINVYRPTVREAQIRSEQLISIAYQAVMDRREQQGSPSENIPPMFGSGVDAGVDKLPVSLKLQGNWGTHETKRGVSIFRLIIKFRLEELTRQEALGVLYAGSDNITSDTTNPPTT